jgi:hypothetical protein
MLTLVQEEKNSPKSRKHRKNKTSRQRRTSNQNLWDSWEGGHFKTTRIYKYSWRFDGDKFIRRRGAAFAGSRPKLKRRSTSKHWLELIRSHLSFFNTLVTLNKTWLHHQTLETKNRSKQSIFFWDPVPKMAKRVKIRQQSDRVIILGLQRHYAQKLFAIKKGQ